jgi:hypothetical protein
MKALCHGKGAAIEKMAQAHVNEVERLQREHVDGIMRLNRKHKQAIERLDDAHKEYEAAVTNQLANMEMRYEVRD